ncbi:MAG: hypothetical protein N3G21_09510, partial [Candidatus Hydrogenedentes bacterium]|nr:hypothetical protein [Candidatus Hydrogenedentota bacterium]
MSTKNTNTVRCPKCGFEINVNEVLYQEIKESLSREYSSEREQLLAQIQQEREKYEREIAIKMEEI